MTRAPQQPAVAANTAKDGLAADVQSNGLSRAVDRVATAAILFAHRNWQRLKRLGVVRRALYSVENADEFSKVYSHEVMLADRGRVDAYQAAIARAVRPGDTVVDLGTGTGILAMLAARSGAKLVYAVDQTAVVDLARHVAETNGIRNVHFVRSHSKDFNPGEKVDLILHEQIGDYLIDEDMIANVCELRDRVLAPGGRILPARFEAYLEPVSMVEGRGVPLLWDQKIHGIDYSCTRAWLAVRKEFETHIGRQILPGQASEFLADPEPFYTLDLEEVAADYVPGTMKATKVIVREGVLAGFAHYFRIDFGNGIEIENSPFEKERALTTSHWAPSLFPVHYIPLKRGDVIEIEWTVDQPTRFQLWKIKWRVLRDGETIASSQNLMRMPWS